MTHFRKILVPIDGSNPSESAVALALQLAGDGSASALVFCNVVDVEEDYREAAEAMLGSGPAGMIADDTARGTKTVEAAVRAAKDVGLDAAGEVLVGNPAKTIVGRARDGGFDLIVIGTHGRHGIERMFLGSTAERVLRGASVPVLTVK